ncbi:putative membrane protein [Halogranum amylolyticum]|uniref:Putative membrane protein n=1 Tax=Halogranum amylolyticum TaxID=660520 RepID=A0A1H8W0Q8_9EURY|nr:SHOCT domain-containing protein [Halogranum amylolyticum]SEP20748.1 putative membrane protein [Halogranum amylolyticum]
MATTTTTNRLIVAALIALALLVFLPGLFMGGGMMGFGGPMMGWMYGTNAPGWMLFVGLLGQLLVVALVVGLGYLGYKALTGAQTDTAMEELRTAFARGEIDDEEFERRKERLKRDER